mmetsp:Transcript_27805/g.31775  ORF Transcript_27805/g.31775 Transcript_27805/m.31775 type:complete len:115 (-) Transcript_27805:383-727(-)
MKTTPRYKRFQDRLNLRISIPPPIETAKSSSPNSTISRIDQNNAKEPTIGRRFEALDREVHFFPPSVSSRSSSGNDKQDERINQISSTLSNEHNYASSYCNVMEVPEYICNATP